MYCRTPQNTVFQSTSGKVYFPVAVPASLPVRFPRTEILSSLVAGKVSVSDRCSPFRGCPQVPPRPRSFVVAPPRSSFFLLSSEVAQFRSTSVRGLLLALIQAAVSSSPSMNFSPAMTNGICSCPINRRQVFSASRANLNTIVSVAIRDPHPLVFLVRSLTVA